MRCKIAWSRRRGSEPARPSVRLPGRPASFARGLVEPPIPQQPPSARAQLSPASRPWDPELRSETRRAAGIKGKLASKGSQSTMKPCVALALLALTCGLGTGVEAWGGLFNRFSPEMLSNMGYGSHGGYLGRSSAYLQHGSSFGDNGLDDAVEPCYERHCSTNEDCCPSSVCIAINDGAEWPEGRCMFIYGLKQGELCRRDNDCETGLMCMEVAGSDSLSCQPPVTSNKQYSESCTMSSECDISRGLCCQLQRRHRQTPRKMCSYFKDPLVCIGPVAADQVKQIVQYTSGEKRITGKNNKLYKRGFA